MFSCLLCSDCGAVASSLILYPSKLWVFNHWERKGIYIHIYIYIYNMADLLGGMEPADYLRSFNFGCFMWTLAPSLGFRPMEPPPPPQLSKRRREWRTAWGRWSSSRSTGWMRLPTRTTSCAWPHGAWASDGFIDSRCVCVWRAVRGCPSLWRFVG